MATFKGQLETKTGTNTSDVLYPKTSVDQVDGLPTPTSADSGKVVGVNSSGQYVLVDAGGGGGDTPPTTPTDAVIFYSKYQFSLWVDDNVGGWDDTEYYSTNYSTWNVWDGTTTLTAVQSDGYYKLYLRGTGNTGMTNYGQNVFHFIGQAIKCCGNLNNLLDYTTTPTLAEAAFAALFAAAGNVGFDVTLPSETLADYCYSSMFANCTSLTTAPSLPATTLAYGCYNSMFFNCTSLTTAPSLPATTLADDCYGAMFYQCTSLTTAPSLPATTLAYGCYNSMFVYCINLTTLPALPATTLPESSYLGMFGNCKQIKLSTTQTGEYQNPYRIPTSGTGVGNPTSGEIPMFAETGGTFVGNPTINTTYYTSNTIV